MYSFSLARGSLGKSFCGSTRWSAKRNRKVHAFKYSHKRANNRCFTCTRSARKYHNSVAKRVAYCLLLKRGIFYAQSAFLSVNKSIYIANVNRRAYFIKQHKLLRDIFFIVKIALCKYKLRAFVKYIFKLFQAKKLRNSLIAGIKVNTQKLGRTLAKLLSRQANVSVLRRIFLQNIMNSTHNSVKIIVLHTYSHSERICALKAYTVYFVAKPIRILFCNVNGGASPLFINTYGSRRTKIITEEHHSISYSCLLLKALGRRQSHLSRYSLYSIGKPIGMIFYNVKAILTKCLNYFNSGFRPYTLYCS